MSERVTENDVYRERARAEARRDVEKAVAPLEELIESMWEKLDQLYAHLESDES